MNIDINQIETYTPTIYVNNSEPDLDETNLNHTEQALKRVTDAANAAILALKSLDSAKIDAAKIVNNLLATDASTVLSGPMGKALGDRLTAAENLLTQLNGDTAKTIYSNVFRDVQYISCVSDIKLVLRSTDPDNHCLILAQDSSAGALSTFGYYGTSKGWCIDGKSIATK